MGSKKQDKGGSGIFGDSGGFGFGDFGDFGDSGGFGFGDLGNLFGNGGGGFQFSSTSNMAGGGRTIFTSSSSTFSSGGRTVKKETVVQNGKRVTKTVESDGGTRATVEEQEGNKIRRRSGMKRVAEIGDEF